MRNRKLIIFLLAWSITNSRPISTQLKWKVHSKDCIIQYLLICLWGMLQFSMIFSVFDAESSTVCRVALPNEKWQAAALGSRRMNRRFSWSPCSGSIHGRMRPGFPCKSNRNTNTPYRLVLTAMCCWGTMRCGRPNNAGMIQKQILNKIGLCAVLGHKLTSQEPGLNNPRVVFGPKTLFTCRGFDQIITRFIIREG